MRRSRLIITPFIAASWIMACSDPGVMPPKQEAPDQGDSTIDQGPDLKPSCTPKTCEELGEVCGVQEDGCGGTLDCGVCKTCTAAAPADEGCGPCGLGVPSCDEVNGVTCSLPELPGLDANSCAEAILYVDSAHAGEQTGSKNAPFKSINAALEASNASTKLIAVRGNELYRESLTAKDGIHIVGGFDAQWQYQPNLRAIINTPAPDDADVFGLSIKDLQTPTVFANLNINTEDAPTGHSNYAIYVNNAGPARLISLKSLAGKGGDGADGEDGAKGKDGVVGIDGLRGGPKTPTPSFVFPFGVGGASVNTGCNNNSGKGGDGATLLVMSIQTIERPPQAGSTSALGVMGGSAGRVNVLRQPPFEHAKPGADGPAYNTSAINGMGGKKDSFEFSDDLWTRGTNSDGKDGALGQPGPSGGGGGGGFFHKEDEPDQIGGPGGGSGGAGGCGGQGGRGGSGGGASFGLFVVNSESLMLSQSSFTAASGGDGGKGGKGADGGKGAVGGKGGTEICRSYMVVGGDPLNGIPGTVRYSNCSTANSKGGDGGKGADGQRGGSGGGGAGGPSYGAFCVGTTVDTVGVVTFLAGPSAPGGIGGDNQGNDGEKGLSIDEYQCVND